MRAPWWARERTLDATPVTDGIAPVLHPPGRGEIVRQLLHRAASYTSDWTVHRDGDAGFALVRLFSEMAEPLLTRLNRLPEKTFIEFLRGAGIGTMPELPAGAMVVFEVDEAAPGSVLIAAGTQLSVEPADGSDAPVIFETERTLHAAPLAIAAAFRKSTGLFEQVDLAAARQEGGLAWRPFGSRPRAGAELLIGLSGKVAPRTSLSLAIELAAVDGTSPPVASGGGAPAAQFAPLLKWEVMDGASFEPAQIVRDETRSLSQSGIVELKLPPRWRMGKPAGIDLPEPQFWLRLRLAHGEFGKVPAVRAVHINAVEATAVQTVRDEVLEFVPGSDRRQLRLSRGPILPGSLQLVVIEPGIDGDAEVPWIATDSLARHGASDRVYVLDAATGILEFGNNLHGMRLPLGFRNIVARKYQVGGGLAGRVPAEADFTLAQPIPFVRGVTNPQPASGGKAAEKRSETMRRGPLEIRTGGRAVTLADYELLATKAPGADVARARAIACHDSRFSGASIPGSVTILLVSSDRGAEPPLADAGTLEAVSTWLTETVAPAGIQVVAATPQFHRIGVRASISIEEGRDAGQAVATALTNLQDYLHPLRGGPDGSGWPFGGTIRHQAITRMLIDRTPGVVAVPKLNLVVNGALQASCLDWALPAHSLIWPTGHEVIPIGQEASA